MQLDWNLSLSGEDYVTTQVWRNAKLDFSVNMFAASLAVNEFLALLHPFREEPNATWAAVEFSLASMELFGDPDEGICELMADKVGRGDVTPPLDMLELAERRAE